MITPVSVLNSIHTLYFVRRKSVKPAAKKKKARVSDEEEEVESGESEGSDWAAAPKRG